MKSYFRKLNRYGLVVLPLTIGLGNFLLSVFTKASMEIQSYLQYSKYVGIVFLFFLVFLIFFKDRENRTQDDLLDKYLKQIKELKSENIYR